MARNESDREDLLREATALVERVELRLATGESLVVGFRPDGAASFFFDGDPVYHFNRQGQLRRAFLRGRLLKAERGRLMSLERRRSAEEVALVRRELDQAAAQVVLADLRTKLSVLRQTLTTGGFQLIGQVPERADVTARALEQLDDLLSRDIVVAASPGLRGN